MEPAGTGLRAGAIHALGLLGAVAAPLLLAVASPLVLALLIYVGGTALQGRTTPDGVPLLAVSLGAWTVGALLWQMRSVSAPAPHDVAVLERVFE